MNGNHSSAVKNVEMANAPLQKRGSYGSSDFLSGGDPKPGFDPSSSSREMRKIMYYENMFSKLDSMDKTKKSPSSSQSLSHSDSGFREDSDESDLLARARQTKSSGSPRKTATGRVQPGSYNGSKQMVVKLDTISIKIKSNVLGSSPKDEYSSAKSSTRSSMELDNAVQMKSGSSGEQENQVGQSEVAPSITSSNNSLPNVTDIAGSKISKMLGIEQTARSSTELSASQRQWLVPTFPVPETKDEKEESEGNSNEDDSFERDLVAAVEEIIGPDAAEDEELTVDEKPEGKTTGKAGRRATKEETMKPEAPKNEYEALKVEASVLIDEEPMDVVIESQEPESVPTAATLQPAQEQVEPIVPRDGQEMGTAEAAPEEEEEPVQMEENTMDKRLRKRRTRQKKGTQAPSYTNGYVSPPPETKTPDNVPKKQVYVEPLPPATRTSRSRAGSRSSRQRKRDAQFPQDSEAETHVPNKTPRGSGRSGGRGSSHSRKNMTDANPSKSHHIAYVNSMGTGSEEAPQMFPAVSRIISASEAEKILRLYRQHSTDIQRLKKLILMGDLTGFGNAVLEEHNPPSRQRICILDPRNIVAQPHQERVVKPREQPPENPVELSLKYRLLSKYTDLSKKV